MAKYIYQCENWTDFTWDDKKISTLLAQVRSSIARRLGLEIVGLVESARNIDGIVEMIQYLKKHSAPPKTVILRFGSNGF